ncbi:B3/B4 domain-containing protein [Paenibacillus xylaniclasticus]|uniref:B3/B4 domain-containing protein n=1 Tax=Paenibacillus xylaniclasticus TaxID=588083 RepID=UPI0013DF7147|nr:MULTISPECIES: phenylalanine--tRNA ligase beta subunit-related protein [Paenibacillus]GFN32280.1 hypothetical protein PCURB6_25400 [Paenibacillus curdlanolyticus]
MFNRIEITEQVKERLGGINVYGCRLQLSPKEAAADYSDLWEQIHSRWRGKTKAEVASTPLVAVYSQFYASIGLDTKKTPPSVQNMLQRFFIKDELERVPLIHPIVDAVNIAALQHLIPLGVFDADCVNGPLRLTYTKGGEPFQGLGAAEPELLPEGLLVLADDEKTLSRFCYRDSEVQKVTDKTRNICLLGCQVPGVDQEIVEQSLRTAIELLERKYRWEAAEELSSERV